jgi:hypothetical protein
LDRISGDVEISRAARKDGHRTVRCGSGACRNDSMMGAGNGVLVRSSGMGLIKSDETHGS